jgi:predicted nucleic acid-binding protein
MATNLAVDDGLIEEAKAIGNHRTKKGAVTEALQEYIQRKKQMEREDYELAAEYFNTARNKGIQGSNTDFLICAISTRREMPAFTTDKDFIHYQSVLPVRLHEIRI